MGQESLNCIAINHNKKEAMKANKHTQGPWGLNEYIDGEFEVYGKGEERVAMCGFYGQSDATSKANAALISAAPDLLKGCEAALEAILDPNADGFTADKLEAVLRAAISKATGVV